MTSRPPKHKHPPAPMPAPPANGYDLILHLFAGTYTEKILLRSTGHKWSYNTGDAYKEWPEPIEGGAQPWYRGFTSNYEAFGETLQTKVDVVGLLNHLTQEKGVKASIYDDNLWLDDYILYCSLAESSRSEAKSGRGSLVLGLTVPQPPTSYAVEQETAHMRSIARWIWEHTTR